MLHVPSFTSSPKMCNFLHGEDLKVIGDFSLTMFWCTLTRFRNILVSKYAVCFKKKSPKNDKKFDKKYGPRDISVRSVVFWRVWHVWPVWRICDRHMCDTGRVTVDAFLEPPRRNVQWPLPPDRRTEITGFSELKKNRRKKKKNQQIWPKFKNQTTNAKKKKPTRLTPPPWKKKIHSFYLAIRCWLTLLTFASGWGSAKKVVTLSCWQNKSIRGQTATEELCGWGVSAHQEQTSTILMASEETDASSATGFCQATAPVLRQTKRCSFPFLSKKRCAESDCIIGRGTHVGNSKIPWPSTTTSGYTCTTHKHENEHQPTHTSTHPLTH